MAFIPNWRVWPESTPGEAGGHPGQLSVCHMTCSSFTHTGLQTASQEALENPPTSRSPRPFCIDLPLAPAYETGIRIQAQLCKSPPIINALSQPNASHQLCGKIKPNRACFWNCSRWRPPLPRHSFVFVTLSLRRILIINLQFLSHNPPVSHNPLDQALGDWGSICKPGLVAGAVVGQFRNIAGTMGMLPNP